MPRQSECTDTYFAASLRDEINVLLSAVEENLREVHAFTPDLTARTEQFTQDRCVRIGDLWAIADAFGVHTQQLKQSLPLVHQFLLELIITIYNAGRGSVPLESDRASFLELVTLLEQSDTALPCVTSFAECAYGFDYENL